MVRPRIAGRSAVSLAHSGLCASCSASLIHLYWSRDKCGLCQNRRKLGRFCSVEKSRILKTWPSTFYFHFYSLYFVLRFLKYCLVTYYLLHKWDHPYAVMCLTISQSMSSSLCVVLSFFRTEFVYSLTIILLF